MTLSILNILVLMQKDIFDIYITMLFLSLNLMQYIEELFFFIINLIYIEVSNYYYY